VVDTNARVGNSAFLQICVTRLYSFQFIAFNSDRVQPGFTALLMNSCTHHFIVRRQVMSCVASIDSKQ